MLFWIIFASVLIAAFCYPCLGLGRKRNKKYTKGSPQDNRDNGIAKGMQSKSDFDQMYK